MRNRVMAAACAAVLAACTVGPVYHRPDAPTPGSYREAGEDWKRAQPGDGIPRGSWWEMFSEPQLNALAKRVEVSNQNMRAAEARFRQAQAVRHSKLRCRKKSCPRWIVSRRILS